jgi:tetratricopeptide (TPR) repeat protein
MEAVRQTAFVSNADAYKSKSGKGLSGQKLEYAAAPYNAGMPGGYAKATSIAMSELERLGPMLRKADRNNFDIQAQRPARFEIKVQARMAWELALNDTARIYQKIENAESNKIHQKIETAEEPRAYPKIETVEDLVRSAIDFEKAGDYKAAADMYAKAGAICGSPGYFRKAAKLLKKAGRLEAAAEMYERAGMISRKDGDFEMAAKLLKKVGHTYAALMCTLRSKGMTKEFAAALGLRTSRDSASNRGQA